ncbi:MAG: ABC transporter ATP-binding protein [Thermoplasmata archaeon]|nr:MAG: ABC transporter ATP-binding protein [Thermoplasmata archaeon]
MTLLEIRDLKVYYYAFDGVVKAVDGVSLDIKSGEFFGLIGESGCGKSTLGNAILRLVPPPGRVAGGSIYFHGEDILQLPEDRMREIRGDRISMIFQDPTAALDPVYTIGDQIVETILAHNPEVSKKDAEARAIELLKLVGIPGAEARIHEYPHQFSGGMRQRAVIAIALANNPELLIADEPTTNLDVTIEAQILTLLDELRRKLNMSILLITHNIGIVAEYTDRVGVMYAGKLVEVGRTVDVLTDPKHPYTQGLLGAIPGRGGRKGRVTEIPGTVPNLANPPPGCRFHPRCPKRFDPCDQEEPALVRLPGEGRMVACHLYRGPES